MDSGLSSTEALLLGQNSNRGMFGGGDASERAYYDAMEKINYRKHH